MRISTFFSICLSGIIPIFGVILFDWNAMTIPVLMLIDALAVTACFTISLTTFPKGTLKSEIATPWLVFILLATIAIFTLVFAVLEPKLTEPDFLKALIVPSIAVFTLGITRFTKPLRDHDAKYIHDEVRAVLGTLLIGFGLTLSVWERFPDTSQIGLVFISFATFVHLYIAHTNGYIAKSR